MSRIKCLFSAFTVVLRQSECFNDNRDNSNSRGNVLYIADFVDAFPLLYCFSADSHCSDILQDTVNNYLNQSINQREICRAPLYDSSRSVSCSQLQAWSKSTFLSRLKDKLWRAELSFSHRADQCAICPWLRFICCAALLKLYIMLNWDENWNIMSRVYKFSMEEREIE